VAINQASNYTGDVLDYLEDTLLPLAQKKLVAYKFGEPIKLPEGRGTQYNAVRLQRLALPTQPLSEGVPPVGQLMSLETISGTVQQWGAIGTITDVAENTVFHPPFQNLIRMLALQTAELLERNTFNTLNSGTQVQYAGGAASRFALSSTDVMDGSELIKASGILRTLGAPMFDGDMETDVQKDAGMGGANASKSPRMTEHYVAINHPAVTSDLRSDTVIQTAWSYSDINRLYNHEVGEWNSIRFCESNMVPSFTGAALVGGASPGTSGALATDTYFLLVTASDDVNRYETVIHQVDTGTAVTGPNGSIDITVPSTTGYTYNVYIGDSATPVNLGVSADGPTSGPLQGQATEIAPGTTITITDIGVAQTPPAPVATGVTVYPTYILGRGAYGQVELKGIEHTYLDEADKSDPLNQLLTAGWKVFYGSLILNNQFMARIESGSAFPTTF
jgi:N4-gp56 family major capsid protein